MDATASRSSPLRAIREGQGRTLERVAAEADIDVGYLSKIERGLATPSVQVLYRLASVLEIRELSRLLRHYGGEPS